MPFGVIEVSFAIRWLELGESGSKVAARRVVK
jgi:hypothetical protein